MSSANIRKFRDLRANQLINLLISTDIKVILSAFQYSQLRVRLAGPHQLQPKPDADDLQFGKIFTDHMFKATYHKRLGGWQKPEILPLENLVIHPAAKVLHYAVEVSLKLFHALLLPQLELLTAHIQTRN